MSDEEVEPTLAEQVEELTSRVAVLEDKLAGIASQVQASSVVRPAEPVGEE